MSNVELTNADLASVQPATSVAGPESAGSVRADLRLFTNELRITFFRRRNQLLLLVAALRRTAAPRVAVRTPDLTAAAEVLKKLGLADPVADNDAITAELGDVQPESVTAELVHAGVAVRALTVESPSLEDLFVGLTGEGFDVER